MEQLNSVKRPRWSRAAAAAALVLPLTACGGIGDGLGAGGGRGCELPREIRLIIPFSPGGGYDAWSRLIAPTMAKKLGGDVEIVSENLDGGGGMRGVNTAYYGPSDGSNVVIFSPQDVALAQTMGDTEGDFELAKMTFVGQFTEDPQVFLASADSDIESIKDIADTEKPVKHAGQELSPIELLTYDAYGVNAEYILHEGTPEVALAVRRGDADVTVGSLSSVLEFLKAGEMKPILYVGSEMITPDLPGYEHIKDSPTAEDTGHGELSESLFQNRVMATAPNTPECVSKQLSGALADTLADPKFVAKAEKSDLRVLAGDPDQAVESAERSLKTMAENKDVLTKAMRR